MAVRGDGPNDSAKKQSGADGFLLRPLLAADLPELVDLWIASWTALRPDLDFEARRGWFCDHLAALRQGGATVIAAFGRDNGAMAGFVTIDSATKWLDQIAVAPDRFGAGAGRALMEAARQIAGDRIALDVNADNVRARAFYAAQGFTVAGWGVNARSGAETVLLEWRRGP